MSVIEVKFACLALFTFVPGLDFQEYEAIRDNSLDVNHILFGDLTKMDHMFIDPADYDGPESDERNKEKNNRREHYTDDDNFHTFIFKDILNTINSTGLDIGDFNKITKEFNNETRRYFSFYDPEDHGKKLEDLKQKNVKDTALQFLIHTRYKVAEALKQKEPVRFEKTYKLGYLFNRLRRLKYEMAKITDQSVKQERFVTQMSIMRSYEQVVRFDVDIKDTIELIKAIDKEPDPTPSFPPEIVGK